MQKTRKNCEKSLWLTLSELGDHFAWLDGSNRYFNMSESEIPLYTGCFLVEKYFPSFIKEDFIDKRFFEAIEPISKNLDRLLGEIDLGKDEFIQLISSFVDYWNIRLKNDKNTQWFNFVEFVTLSNNNLSNTL